MRPNNDPDLENPSHRVLLELDGWDVNRHTGQLGIGRDGIFAALNERYGPGNWWFGWEMPNGQVWTFQQVFWNVYVDGYIEYFKAHSDEASYLAENYAYAYDLTPIPKQVAYDPTALVNVPELPNQFHHVALNIAVDACTGGWRGRRPIAVRGPGSEGERWSPGHIPARPEHIAFEDEWLDDWIDAWWEWGSIEAVYQYRRKLFTRLPAEDTRQSTA